MPRRPASATQADIARAIRAMRGAGYTDVQVVFKDGAVFVEAIQGDAGPRASDDDSDQREQIDIL